MSQGTEPPAVARATDAKAAAPGVPNDDTKETSTHAFPLGDASSSDDGEAFALEKNPFADPQVAAYWRTVYENASYECRHVFDPAFTWTEDEEKKLVRKLDWHVCLWACVMFFGLQVDRGNLVQAVSGTLLKDLGLTTNGRRLIYFLVYMSIRY